MDAASIERRVIMADHESRLRAIEIGGASSATLALAVAAGDARLKALENSILAISAREQGVVGTLGAGKTAIVVGAAAFGAVVAALDLISHLFK
jgi:hypothetical protein